MSRNPLYLLLTLLTLLPGRVPAQHFEAGVFAGMSAYIGDLNTDRVFHEVYPAGGVVARFNHSQRLSTRINAVYSVLRGSDRDPRQAHSNILENADYPSVYYEFETEMVELSVQGEFHLLPFPQGDRLIVWAPYLFAGAGGLYFSPSPMQSSPGGSTGVPTGGAHWHLDDDAGYTELTWVGVAGLGVKYQLSRSFTASLEMGLRITGSDYLDEVSHRGDPGRSDWYTLTGLSLTYGINRSRGIRNGHIRQTRPSMPSGARCPN